MTYSGQIKLANLIYLKLTTFSLLQLTKPSFSPALHSLSFAMAILGLIFAIAYPVWMHKFLKRKTFAQLKMPVFKERWGAIYEAFSLDDPKTTSFEVVILAKKFMTAVTLVFLQPYPVAQVSAIVTLSVAYYVLLQKWKPFKHEKVNSGFVTAEFFWIIGMTLLLFLAFKEDEFPLVIYKIIGWVACVIFSV